MLRERKTSYNKHMLKYISAPRLDHSNQLVSRRLTFPDGIDRIITLRQRVWEMMAFLARNDGSGSEQETIDIAYQLACEFHDPRKMSFEAQIRDCMDAAIRGSMTAYQHVRLDIIQDDFASHGER